MNPKYLLLGSLYLAQGLPYGFFTQALPVILRENKLSLPLIGLAQLLMLPWALKFLWAPLVDGVEAPRRGRRRAVIIPLQLLAVFLLAALALAPEAMAVLAVGVLLVNFCAATQDIATDALAVETLTPAERGIGNGLQVGAYRVGMVLGGGAILVVFGRAGWTAAFLSLAALLALSTLPILRHREVPAPRPTTTKRAVLRDSFARPGFRSWLVVLVTYKTGEWFATAMLRTFLTDAGITIDEIGVMVGLCGFSAALLGSFAGGALTTKLGRRRALVAFGVVQTLAIASMALAVVAPSTPMFYAIVVAEHLASGMATAALFTAMMDFSRPGTAGTDYTVQASLVVIATGIAVLASGFSAKALGYAGHFLVAAGLSAIGTIAVLAYRPKSRELTLL
jgi:MFS transporter, PAT family, beta-lactamase induction signal transducer AmpG